MITADNSDPKYHFLRGAILFLAYARPFASLHVMKAVLHVLDGFQPEVANVKVMRCYF
jgi:hypothetical protein